VAASQLPGVSEGVLALVLISGRGQKKECFVSKWNAYHRIEKMDKSQTNEQGDLNRPEEKGRVCMTSLGGLGESRRKKRSCD